MIIFDMYAYANALRANAAEKCSFAIFTMIIGLLSRSIIVPGSIIVIVSVIIVAAAKVPTRQYIKLLLLPVSFLILSVFTVMVTTVDNAENIVISASILGQNLGITSKSMEMALKLVLKSLSAVSCLYFLALTTPMVEIILVLKKLKLPTILIELMGLIYKSIFVLLETAQQIYVSQDARLGYRSVRRGYSSLGQLISTLFIKSLHRSERLYISLESRGYTGDLRVLEMSKPFSRMNILAIVLIDSLLVALLVFIK
jgi:cobalt/nickel transport system permease protein